jgi:hypothetical protein
MEIEDKTKKLAKKLFLMALARGEAWAIKLAMGREQGLPEKVHLSWDIQKMEDNTDG